MHDETFKEHFGHNLAEAFVFGMLEEVQKAATEPVRVGVRVMEIEDDGADEVVLSYK
jgi:hypothetical protein